MEDSLYTVDLQLEDHFSNRSTAKHYSFTLDTKVPAVPVVSPVSSPTHKPIQIISGTKEADAALLLNGSQIVGHTAQTTWTYSANLSAGDNSFSFAARDRAGNQSDPVTVAIFFDDVPPPAVDTLTLTPKATAARSNWIGAATTRPPTVMSAATGSTAQPPPLPMCPQPIRSARSTPATSNIRPRI